MPRVHLSRDNAFAAVLFAAGFAYLFRRWLFTGFDGVFGDGGDGEILLALVEHWHRVFAGLARIADPILFYPESGVLGFTDAYLLYGIVHAAGRATGAGRSRPLPAAGATQPYGPAWRSQGRS